MGSARAWTFGFGGDDDKDPDWTSDWGDSRRQGLTSRVDPEVDSGLGRDAAMDWRLLVPGEADASTGARPMTTTRDTPLTGRSGRAR